MEWIYNPLDGLLDRVWDRCWIELDGVILILIGRYYFLRCSSRKYALTSDSLNTVRLRANLTIEVFCQSSKIEKDELHFLTIPYVKSRDSAP